jgi:hypothetical protein
MISARKQQYQGNVQTSLRAPETETRHSSGNRCGSMLAKMKERQSHKIREMREALVAAGLRSLDEQAKVLGLSRSTAWSVLRGNHKSSGLSVTIINRMLAAPQLPPRVRARIEEYVEEKAAGLYGHSEMQRIRFTARLTREWSQAPTRLRQAE